MERITFEDTAKELIKQLERTLAKLAIAADCKIGTGELEAKAQKLAAKLKASATLFGNLPLYKDIGGSPVYSWNLTDKLPDDIFVRYAQLCKTLKDQVDVWQAEGLYYAKIAEGLFCSLVELPNIDMPTFKVKLEGDTLMAIRTDLYEKLPEATKKLIEIGGTNGQQVND
jgi:hypothetical protein